MTEKEWLMGARGEKQDLKAKTFLAMEFNRYVYLANWKNEQLSFNKWKARIRATENTERRITTKKNRMHKHESKWKAIL